MFNPQDEANDDHDRTGQGHLPAPQAARLLLEDALRAASASNRIYDLDNLPRGLTIVEVADPIWLWPVARSLEAQTRERGDQCFVNTIPEFVKRPTKADKANRIARMLGERDGIFYWPDDGRSLAIMVPDPSLLLQLGREANVAVDLKPEQEKFAAKVARVTVTGMTVFVFTDDATTLAPPLRAAADTMLRVPDFGNAHLGRLVQTLFTGSHPREMPGVGKVTPLMLDLAWREDDTAVGYIERVRRLAGTEAASPPKAARPAAASPDFPDRLEDVRGMDGAVGWARQLTADLGLYRTGELGWEDVDRGAVLAGPPGVGKTRLARLIAAEAGIPLFDASVATWQRQDSERSNIQSRIGATFEQAREAAPCLLLIDEIDAIWTREGRRDHNSSYFTGIIAALLEALDGPTPREGVVVIGTTNKPDSLDPALLRPGRLERVIEVPRPHYDALRAMIDSYTGRIFSPDQLDEAARLAVGREATGATVAYWARGFRRRARNAGREPVFEDLLEEIRG